MTTSPFSLSHDWALYWKRVYNRGNPNVNGESPVEQKALQALGAVGAIGGSQLSRLFLKRDKNKLKRMIRQQKIIRHEIKKNRQSIPIYTLGPGGARMANVPNYEENYWVTYQTEDVLKRLLFFQLYDKFPKAQIVPAPSPFVGAVSFKGNLFYVYVVRGDMQDMLTYLKWRTFNERMLIVTESLSHLQPLNAFAPDLKVRVTTDQDLRGGLENLFYRWADGYWLKENQQKQVEAANN